MPLRSPTKKAAAQMDGCFHDRAYFSEEGAFLDLMLR